MQKSKFKKTYYQVSLFRIATLEMLVINIMNEIPVIITQAKIYISLNNRREWPKLVQPSLNKGMLAPSR